MARASHYMHGSDPREQARLELMNRLLDARHLAAIAPAPGARVLDLGCGTGLFALELARALGPAGRVVAVERDPRQLEAARARLAADPAGVRVELRAGDAFDPPLAPGEWGAFDLAHARFLLEHVPEPQEVVRALVRAARPGGRVVLADDDHDVLRLFPDAPAVEALWRAYVRAYERRGNDPFVGRKLVALLHAAGAAPVRAEWLFFGACAGEELFPVVVANLRGILDGARPEVAADLPPERVDAALAELDRWAARPDATFWYPLCWAEARAPQAP